MSAESFLYDECPVWNGTNREWLKDILLTLFNEGESFSGKRPNCDSGWKKEIVALLKEHSTNIEQVLFVLFEPEQYKENMLEEAEEHLERYKAAILNLDNVVSVKVGEYDGMPMIDIRVDMPMTQQSAEIMEELIDNIVGPNCDYILGLDENIQTH